MNVTIGVKGGYRKSLIEPIAKPEVQVIEETQSRWWNSPRTKATTKAIAGFAVPIALLASGLPPIGLLHATTVMAATTAPAAITASVTDTVKGTVLHVFDPLIDLIQTLSYPIAGVMIAGGCLFIMVGNRDRGMQMMQNAAIGYILVQLAPVFLKLLVGIGASI